MRCTNSTHFKKPFSFTSLDSKKGGIVLIALAAIGIVLAILLEKGIFGQSAISITPMPCILSGVFFIFGILSLYQTRKFDFY